jgi:hypothetical protein
LQDSDQLNTALKIPADRTGDTGELGSMGAGELGSRGAGELGMDWFFELIFYEERMWWTVECGQWFVFGINFFRGTNIVDSGLWFVVRINFFRGTKE